MTGWKEDAEGWKEASQTQWYKDNQRKYNELYKNEDLFMGAVTQTSLDDAIKYAEEIANSEFDNRLTREYKQLLNWLKELKEYKEKEPVTTTNNDEPIIINYPIITCNDTISREAVNTLVDELARAISDERCHIPQRGRDTGHIMHDILDLPSVQPSRRKGHWIRDCHTRYTDVCSECGFKGHSIDLVNGTFVNYCPNCGADMRGDI